MTRNGPSQSPRVHLHTFVRPYLKHIQFKIVYRRGQASNPHRKIWKTADIGHFCMIKKPKIKRDFQLS